MKATVKRLIERNEELKGTSNYNEQYMEFYTKENKSWKFLMMSYPTTRIPFKVVGTKDNIFLEDELGDMRYKLNAENMPYIDFE